MVESWLILVLLLIIWLKKWHNLLSSRKQKAIYVVHLLVNLVCIHQVLLKGDIEWTTTYNIPRSHKLLNFPNRTGTYDILYTGQNGAIEQQEISWSLAIRLFQ